MKLLTLSAEDVRAALPMRECVEAMKDAFAALSRGDLIAPQRAVIQVPPNDDILLLMGACLPRRALCAKVVSVFPRNREEGLPALHGLVVALDAETGEPAALCDGAFLTAWRTGAASGAATDLLARSDGRVGAVIGCGAQARTQVMAIDAVRELAEIRLFDCAPDRAAAFAVELQAEVRARLMPCDSASAAVTGADVVCAATTSRSPVFDGAELEVGAHVNGVGSFRPDMRELDARTIERARLFVDHREAALAEAGELIDAVARGATRPEDWVELGEVATGIAEARRSATEVTLFKSVGQAAQDVFAMDRILGSARRLGLGRAIEL